MTNVLYRQRITDEPTCYKLVKTDLIKSLELVCDRFEFCPEVTAKVARLGYKIREVPVNYYPRSITEGIKIRWTTVGKPLPPFGNGGIGSRPRLPLRNNRSDMKKFFATVLLFVASFGAPAAFAEGAGAS